MLNDSVSRLRRPTGGTEGRGGNASRTGTTAGVGPADIDRACSAHKTEGSDGFEPSPGGNTLATATSTATKLTPLGDRVVVKPTPREEMTKSGLVLPDTAKEKPQEGEILAVGPGRILEDGKREPMDVKIGQKVLYGKYAGTEFKLDDDDLLIVSQKDILAVVG